MANLTPKLTPRYIMYGALFTGLAASISFRALILLEHIEPSWVRPLWYFAVIEGKKPLTTDRAMLTYPLNSVKKSPENVNYIIISIFSLLAIASDRVLVHMG